MLPRPRHFFVELDVMRGIAAILMIVNHVGLGVLSPADASSFSISGVLVFLGSFAPVLFFFATGAGIGLGAGAGRSADLGSAVWKAALLVVADQFFFLAADVPWGLDFFGFIGLSTIVVTLVARTRRPVAMSVLLICLLLGARYGFGPLIRARPGGNPFVEWLIGVNSVEHVSYPASPWLVYPLLGFLAGRTHRPAVSGAWAPWSAHWRTALVATVVPFGIAAFLFFMKSVFFRWGTVSVAFFVLSLAVIGGTGLLSLHLTRSHPRVADRLALRGVASFVVIPLHYAILHLLTTSPWFVALDLPVFAAVTLAVIVVTIGLSVAIARVLPSSGPTWSWCVLLVAVLCAAALTRIASQSEPSISPFAILAGQLLVAALLALRTSSRRG